MADVERDDCVQDDSLLRGVECQANEPWCMNHGSCTIERTVLAGAYYVHPFCIVLYSERYRDAETNKGRAVMWLPEEIEEDELGVWIRPTKNPKPSSFAELNEEMEKELTAKVERLTIHLYMLDQRIENLKEGLALLQPHGTGRIDIRYWKKKIAGRHPVPVVWVGERIGSLAQLRIQGNSPLTARRKRLYLPVRLPAGRLSMFARRKGRFAKTVVSVREVLKYLQVLMDARQVLLDNVQRFKTSMTLAIRNQNLAIDKVDRFLAKRMPDWRAQAEARYTELSERRRDHIILLEEEDERLSKKGFQFGTKPPRKKL